MNFISNLDLLTVGVAVAATFILGFAVYFNNRKSVSNITFLLFSLTTAIWGVVNYLNYQISDPTAVLWLLRFVLFTAVWQAFLIFQFFYVFPSENRKFPWWHKYGLFPIACCTSMFTLTKYVFSGINELSPVGVVSTTKVSWGIYIFGVIAVGLVISAIGLLIKRIYQSKAEGRRMYEIVLWGVGTTFFLIVVFNFILPGLLLDVRFIPFGALFILPFVAFTSYSTYRYKLFNIKNVTTMVIAFALTVTTFLEVIYSTDYTQVIFRSSIFVLVLIFSIQLIRNMITLEKANEKLKELDQMKSEFVSLATHQIRAPLSAIKGYLSEVFEGDFGPVTSELEKPLRIVAKSTENLINIVADFLSISRIEQGNMKYELAPLDLKPLVAEVVKEFKPSLERAGLEIQFEAPENTYMIRADIGKVKQVIGNLIDNSTKYTPHGSIKISLTSDPQTEKVLFAINDTGIGIPAGVIPKLFQKFTRANNANEVNIIGTGLGLYVARLMIEGQGGRVWAESPGAGKGSTFYVELPMKN